MRIFKICSLFISLVSFSMFAQSIKEYKVKKGESLVSIARKNNVSYRDLKKANPELSMFPKKRTIVKIPVNDALELKEEIKNPVDYIPDDANDLISVVRRDSLDIHIVKPKETLYSLAKWYKTSMITLIKNNPILSTEGLKIGQELRVPFKKPVVLSSSKNHIVKPQETWYGISTLYNVDIDSLKALNPIIAKEGIKENSILEIPESPEIFSIENDEEDNGDDENEEEVKKIDKNSHLIAQGETLYSVSKYYGISVDELLAENDTVVVDSLTIGSVLKLPKKVIETVEVSTVLPVHKQSPVLYNYNTYKDTLEVVLEEHAISLDSLKSLNPKYDSIVNNGGDFLLGFKKTHQLFANKEWFKDSIITDKPIGAMLMLPFEFKKTDSLSERFLFSNPTNVTNYVSDFYMGAKIAVDSLKKQGIQLNFDVVDTEKKNSSSIYENIETFRAMEPDLIIGPIHSSNARSVATLFTGTPMYYPIYSSKQNSFSNSNLISTAPSKFLYEKEITAYIKENRKGEHLLIVGLEKNREKLEILQKELIKKDTLDVVLDENDVTILTLSKEDKGYISTEDFLEKIKLNKSNWILIANKENTLTSDVFNNVINIPEENRDTTAFRIMTFEKSDHIKKMSYKDLAKYKYTYATDEVEYAELENTSFEQTYLRKNNQFPTYYATRGFDITYDAILRELKRENGGKDTFAPSHRVKTAFIYKKEGEEVMNKNQAVFVNAIENTEEEGLKIIRLR